MAKKALSGIPELKPGMKIQQRVRPLPKSHPYPGRAYSQCLVSGEGIEIATIATEAVPDVRRAIRP